MNKLIASITILSVFFFFTPFRVNASGIARDTSAKFTANTSTSVSGSMTLASGATVLIGYALYRSGGDIITGMTWNGVSMTLLTKLNTGAANTYIYVFYMLNPTTGTHTLAASASSAPASDFDIYGTSYTGTITSSFPDNSTTATGASSPISVSLTPVGSGAWTILFGEQEASALTAGTGSNLLQNQHGSGVYDSNGTVSGSYNMQATYSGPSNWGGIMLSIAPPASAPSSFGDLFFFGWW